MGKKNNIKNKVGSILEFPKEIVEELPKVTVLGFENMLIESYKTVVEYSENLIKLSTKIGYLIIEGFNLQVKEITNDDAQITGEILHIEFEKI